MRALMLGLTAALTFSSIEVPKLFQQARAEMAIATRAPAPWLAEDPADSLYRLGRAALSRQQFQAAAEHFGELNRRFPRSGYAGDALYWEAFARYRLGGDSELKTALARLEDQRRRYPRAATTGDAEALATRIRGELARRGDVASAEAVTVEATAAGEAEVAVAGRAPDGRYTGTRATVTSPRGGGRAGRECDDDSDVKAAALNAVLQMDSERALPLLNRVLANRTEATACLRRKAVFLVAQKAGPQTEDILISTAQQDPDPEVREQAVFWLSQVSSPRAVAALDSIAQRSSDPGLQEKAVFALSQQRDPRAAQALRAIAERKDVRKDIRGNAIFWLGQSKSGGGEYLRGLYTRLDDDELKEKVIFGIAQSGQVEDRRWLLEMARNARESVEMRKKAIFWSSQGGTSAEELGGLYRTLQETELKEQVIFALSQVKGPGAVDQMIEIARKDKDPEMRKKAVFWLGQSRDPRAAQLIEEILSE